MKFYNETPTGYRFNKLLFISVIFILVGVFLYNLFINGYEQHPYFICRAEGYGVCLNPVAAIQPTCTLWCPPVKCDETWCSQEYLPAGEYGMKPSFIQTNFMFIAWGSIILMFIVNHLLFNRGVKFSMPTKRKILPTWMAWIVKKIYPKFENEIEFKKVNEYLED